MKEMQPDCVMLCFAPGGFAPDRAIARGASCSVFSATIYNVKVAVKALTVVDQIKGSKVVHHLKSDSTADAKEKKRSERQFRAEVGINNTTTLL
jgi:hypothetical protein